MKVGTCRRCKKNYAWTGEIDTAPLCECGSKHDRLEIHKPQEAGAVLHGWIVNAEARMKKADMLRSFERIEEREMALR